MQSSIDNEGEERLFDDIIADASYRDAAATSALHSNAEMTASFLVSRQWQPPPAVGGRADSYHFDVIPLVIHAARMNEEQSGDKVVAVGASPSGGSSPAASTPATSSVLRIMASAGDDASSTVSVQVEKSQSSLQLAQGNDTITDAAL